MIVDESRVSLAATFLDGSDYEVYKATRAGFTTSFVIAAERSGKKVLFVSPTKKIIGDTMNGAAEIVGIYGNSACEYNKREVAQYPILKHLPMTIPEGWCINCTYSEECPILDIERNPDALMKSLTAAKLEAIMISDNGRAQSLQAILSDVDVVLFDEAHTLVTGDVPKIQYKHHLSGLADRLHLANYVQLEKLINKYWQWLRKYSIMDQDFSKLQDLQDEAECCPDNLLIRELEIRYPLTQGLQIALWEELYELARNKEVSDEEVLQLRDLITILSQDKARLSYITQDGKGKIYVCGAIGRMNGAIQSYLKNVARNAAVIFVSGTLYEPHPDFFRGLVGREMAGEENPLKKKIFPDILNTNRKMTIYADTWRLSGTNAQKLSKIPNIVARIKDISEEKQNAPIYLVAPNIAMCNRLHGALKEECPNIRFDYYRSENTLGVKNECRVMIAVGLAEVPKNSYDCLANSDTESYTIRICDVDAASWQAWSRVKDPAGIEPSEVHCIGIKPEDVERVMTWGPDRTVTVSGISVDTPERRKLTNVKYHVSCTEELPKSAVMEPYKRQNHAEQRKASPYIGKIWDAQGDLTDCTLPVYRVEKTDSGEDICTKSSKSTYIYKRGFGEKATYVMPGSGFRAFGALYSNPQTEEEIQITADTLNTFFRSKQSDHAEQQASGGYYPKKTGSWDELIRRMLRGEVTVATYSIGEDGLTVQCAFDFDNHKKTNPALPRLYAAVDHIKELGAQPLVIASGSPDSYHVHIPIMRTAVETSHDFTKTLLNELKKSHKDLDFKNDTETFPKQAKITKRTKFGNALKVPGAVQRKSGKRSQLLDPDTKEPVDVIFITKVLELRQPEQEAVEVGVRQYLPANSRPARASKIGTSQHSWATSEPARISEMRPCILAAINKQLEGSEGNDMRQAIVCEALAAGKTRDEVIAMFEGQDDFDPTITAYYADYIARRGYWPWKCETIQEKCPTLVTCGGCPLREEMSAEIPVEPVMVR